MRWFTYILLLLPALGLAFLNYNINENTRELRADLDETSRAISHGNEELKRLRAEWAYLSQPNRIACLASLYFTELGLMTTTTDVYGALEDIPLFNDHPIPVEAMTASLGGFNAEPVYYASLAGPEFSEAKDRIPSANLQHDCS